MQSIPYGFCLVIEQLHFEVWQCHQSTEEENHTLAVRGRELLNTYKILKQIVAASEEPACPVCVWMGCMEK